MSVEDSAAAAVGFTISYLRAMAYSLPIVSSQHRATIAYLEAVSEHLNGRVGWLPTTDNRNQMVSACGCYTLTYDRHGFHMHHWHLMSGREELGVFGSVDSASEYILNEARPRQGWGPDGAERREVTTRGREPDINISQGGESVKSEEGR